jgi:predicted metalloprotease with PDZ domain
MTMHADIQAPRNRARLVAALAFFAMLSASAIAARAAGGYLGVHLQNLDDALLTALDMKDTDHGVLVSEVVDDSPAADAGFERGDVILNFDGAPARSVRGVTRRVRRADPGDEVKVELLRKGDPRTLKVTLGESPSSHGFAFYSDDDDDPGVHFYGDSDDAGGIYSVGRRGRLGVRIETLDEKLGHYFGTDHGALVLSVNEDSAAEKAGLQPGDVIQGVDGEKVESSGDLTDVLSDFDPGDKVSVEYLRDKKKSKVEVELGEGSSFAWVSPDGDDVRVRGFGPDRLVERLRSVPRPRAYELRRLGENRKDLEDELRSLKEELHSLQEQIQDMKKD